MAIFSQAAKSAACLTAQLLAFSRRQVLRPVVLDPNEVIGRMRELLRHLIRESIGLVIRSSPELGHICADSSQLEQVILNLAINARDAMLPGGTLTISTENIDIDATGSHRFALIDPGHYVMISVSDTGIGMDALAKQHMFEPFFTTKAAGTGLGLATVHGIVKNSRGHIAVESEPGSGTTVRVFFPRTEKSADIRPPILETSQRGAETIILVEDNPHLRELTRDFLNAAGYRVLECASGEQALDTARKFDGTIHLILADVVLPSATGPEIAAELRSLFPDIAVLFMSGYTNDVMSYHGLSDPGPILLQKPFTRAHLLTRVRSALETSRVNVTAGAA